ncbi:ribosome hibernation-promoting factor, HPF/YfiA family [Agromyces marinus]|uniref:Ribosome hibernation promoting factor n=1 Tax=Agromyces marinus TaxID=1389020 RepID=A0ABN6Y8M6_9MICO|nr:ribosome-associated translation inhibitor RaiA [Agromyces marinus]UIP58080.1 Ribosome hibernation promotion factor [Agromyces marinus]BDZ53695.1 ribosomal subunit interface protein [Agromyces marinus]
MELNIVGRNLEVTDRFRAYVADKAEKVSNLSDRAIALDVKVSRHNEKNGNDTGLDRVELTLVGKGPVVRAEADGADKYAAFDVALGRLVERIRRAKDRRKVHRGSRRPTSLREAADAGFAGTGVHAADVEVLEQVRTGNIPIVGEESAAEPEDDYSPVVIRRKVFAATPMTVDDALYHMELVGHDFYLFIDSENHRPSVVYRRKGWDYGVIGLDEHSQADQAEAAEALGLARTGA